MVRLLPLLLVLVPFLAAAQDPASNTVDRPTCTTCKGKGEAKLPCEFCDGDGKGPCEDCALQLRGGFDDRHLAILREVDPEGAKKLEDAMSELEEQSKKLAAVVGYDMLGKTPGEHQCTARCRGGVSFLNSGFPCKACDEKGTVKCVRCKGKGEKKCAPCGGKRTRVVPCPECVGHGTARDPLARTEDARSCPWCEDERFQDCGSCQPEGSVIGDCPTCFGSGETKCGTCAGTTETGCNKCSGTGDLSSYFAAKSSNRCDKCSTKGVLKCGECKKGRVECKTCEGAGRMELPCSLCGGKPAGGKFRALCTGCFDGSEHAWVVTSERLLAAKRYPEARAHIDVAVERAEARVDGLVSKFEGSAKERKAYRKPLDAELKALKKKAAGIRKKAGKKK